MPTKRVLPSDLLKRNAQWCEEMNNYEEETLKNNAAGQNPSILWIGCSDSRVPESVLAKCRPGDIFTHRNIAGQFSETDDSAMSVLTYAIEALGVEYGVLASLSCAKESSPNPLPSPHLDRFLTPLIELCIDTRKEMGFKDGEEPSEDQLAILLRKATVANVKSQVEKVAATKVIQANWAGKKSAFPGEPTTKVQIHGWLHDVSAGKLIDLNVTLSPPK